MLKDLSPALMRRGLNTWIEWTPRSHHLSSKLAPCLLATPSTAGPPKTSQSHVSRLHLHELCINLREPLGQHSREPSPREPGTWHSDLFPRADLPGIWASDRRHRSAGLGSSKSPLFGHQSVYHLSTFVGFTIIRQAFCNQSTFPSEL